MNQPLTDVAGAAIQGNREALNVLLERSRRSVRAYVYARLRDHATADDVTQEVLLRASSNIARLASPGDWLPWLFGIAGNCLREQERSRKRRQRTLKNFAEVKAMTAPDSRIPAMLDALELLDDEAYAVLALKYVEEMSCKEIAGHLRKPVGSVTSTLARAYEAMRQRMSEEW